MLQKETSRNADASEPGNLESPDNHAVNGSGSLELCPENLKIYERHRELFDALTGEATRLRHELVANCQAFATTMKGFNVNDEEKRKVFELFSRDVHLAHREFYERLSFLRNKMVQCKLEQKEKELSEAKEKINKLCKSSVESLEKIQEDINKCQEGLGKITILRKIFELRTIVENENTLLGEVSSKIGELKNRLNKSEMGA